MEQFEFEWEDSVRIRTVTPGWVIKLVLWSVIVAYLPNIVWYFAGYPADAVLMQLLVIMLGMPPVIFFSMRAYRKSSQSMPLKCSIWFGSTDVVIVKTVFTDSFRQHITVWKSGIPLIENITVDRASYSMSVTALFRVEAYERNRDGHRGKLSASDSVRDTVDVKIPADRMKGLMDILGRYYGKVLTINHKGEK